MHLIMYKIVTCSFMTIFLLIFGNHGVSHSSEHSTNMSELARKCDEAALLKALEAGVDPNLLDKYGRSALYVAALNHNPQCVKLLLDFGADPNIGNPKPIFGTIGSVPQDNEKTIESDKLTFKYLVESNADLRKKLEIKEISERFGIFNFWMERVCTSKNYSRHLDILKIISSKNITVNINHIRAVIFKINMDKGNLNCIKEAIKSLKTDGHWRNKHD